MLDGNRAVIEDQLFSNAAIYRRRRIRNENTRRWTVCRAVFRPHAAVARDSFSNTISWLLRSEVLKRHARPSRIDRETCPCDGVCSGAEFVSG